MPAISPSTARELRSVCEQKQRYDHATSLKLKNLFRCLPKIQLVSRLRLHTARASPSALTGTFRDQNPPYSKVNRFFASTLVLRTFSSNSPVKMRIEIKSAAAFLSGLIRLTNHLDNGVLDRFRGKMEEILRHHYQQHWFPETPCKGSGYRCLRINHKMDPIIARAGSACGLNEASLRQLFPNELTLWVDPKEVSYRIGENGSICVLYDGSAAVTRSSSDSTFSSGSTLERLTSCKESIRGNSWGCFTMDSRNVNLEQLAAYVSS